MDAVVRQAVASPDALASLASFLLRQPAPSETEPRPLAVFLFVLDSIALLRAAADAQSANVGSGADADTWEAWRMAVAELV
jgi:hypothetical protein